MTTQRQEAWITSRFTVPTSSHSVYSNSNRHEVVVVDPSPISIVGVNVWILCVFSNVLWFFPFTTGLLQEPITVERLESSLAKGIATEVKTQLQPLNEKITQQDQKITQQDQRITKQQQEILELNKQLAETKQKELQQEWVQMFCDVFSAYKDKVSHLFALLLKLPFTCVCCRSSFRCCSRSSLARSANLFSVIRRSRNTKHKDLT